ncbi:MAG: phosphatidylserine/phosphatidylglycerophosphate/cardiolipin synthase family protein [Proteobacteria bacterium]|nr:phosphatidylserine/phosphatidylglycerophosphate/cardiolipin synthase family protein [Pseudomonadota bacterium]
MSHSHIVLITIGTILLGSCGSNSVSQRSGRKAEGAESSNTDRAQNDQSNNNLETYNSVYQVFNPTYKIDPKSNISPETLAAVFPIHRNDGSQVATLIDGASRFAARAQMIDKAKISIRIQSFIIKGDESGYIIADKLIAAKRRGVNVRILIDPVINGKLDDHRMFYYLQRNDIKIEGYEFLYQNFISSLTQDRTFDETLQDANMRYHEKLFIVDAENPSTASAIIGGANIANEYFYVDKENPAKMWRDQDVVVKGPIVKDLLNSFEWTYQEFLNEKIRKNMQSFESLSAIMNLPFIPNAGPTNQRPAIVSRLKAIEVAPLNLNWQPALMRFLHSRPRQKEDLIAPVYLDMIEKSTSSISIVNAYFVPDSDMIAALTRAVARGVKVKIVTNHLAAQEIEALGHVSRSTYQALMSANSGDFTGGRLDIYEWGSDLILKNGEGQNHAKYAIFDGKAALVGSYNIDPRSRYLNGETIVAFENQNSVGELIKITESFLAPSLSILVSKENAALYANPSGVQAKLKQQFWNLFAPYL